MRTTAKPGRAARPDLLEWAGTRVSAVPRTVRLEQRSSRRNDEPPAARDGEADPVQVVERAGGSR